jgi:hypothetical protein
VAEGTNKLGRILSQFHPFPFFTASLAETDYRVLRLSYSKLLTLLSLTDFLVSPIAATFLASSQLALPCMLVSYLAYSLTLKMEATCCSEALVDFKLAT